MFDLYVFLQLEMAEAELREWRQKLSKWHAEYNWLLFLSVSKVLRIFTLVSQKRATICVTREISFLFQNTQEAFEKLHSDIEVSSQVLLKLCMLTVLLI